MPFARVFSSVFLRLPLFFIPFSSIFIYGSASSSHSPGKSISPVAPLEGCQFDSLFSRRDRHRLSAAPTINGSGAPESGKQCNATLLGAQRRAMASERKRANFWVKMKCERKALASPSHSLSSLFNHYYYCIVTHSDANKVGRADLCVVTAKCNLSAYQNGKRLRLPLAAAAGAGALRNAGGA